MSGQPGPRVAVKMEVAPFYGEDGLELLPDFVQLPPGFNGEAAAAEESGAQQQQKLLLVGAKKAPPRTAPQGPEGSLLKLPGAASDLEQLLLPGLPSPTSPGSSGAPASAFLFRPPPPSAPPPPPPPSAVTQEQEGFADGFVKALADLHKQNQLLGVSPAPLSPSLCPPPPRQEAVYTTLGAFDPGSPAPSGVTTASAPSSAFFSRRALEEPQTVPEASPGIPPAPPPPLPLSSGDSPPPPSASLSPLDAESQERLKAERKRLRNRIAASKCRRRKLERIARLEEKVKALKGQNAELAATASLLRAQVAQLQGRVRSHLSSGCPINATGPGPEAPAAEAEAC
ncbi:transcription factor JunD [Anolis carolinensis]|uniref:transcription factor JunD n=1 Tax=Anolis carolinensis TaxID=28377 RepID=UPI002F2B5C19